MCGPDQGRQIAGTKIEHPLGRDLRILVIPEFRVRVGQEAVDHYIVGDSLVAAPGGGPSAAGYSCSPKQDRNS